MKRDVKCRLCDFVVPHTFRGFADLWKHVRSEHPAWHYEIHDFPAREKSVSSRHRAGMVAFR